MLAVNVSNWLHPDAATSPERSFCHTYARGAGQARMIPGWAHSVVCALETGASSWTELLHVARIRPGPNATAVTASQLRAVIGELTDCGHYRDGNPEVLTAPDTTWPA